MARRVLAHFEKVFHLRVRAGGWVDLTYDSGSQRQAKEAGSWAACVGTLYLLQVAGILVSIVVHLADTFRCNSAMPLEHFGIRISEMIVFAMLDCVWSSMERFNYWASFGIFKITIKSGRQSQNFEFYVAGCVCNFIERRPYLRLNLQVSLIFLMMSENTSRFDGSWYKSCSIRVMLISPAADASKRYLYDLLVVIHFCGGANLVIKDSQRV